MKLGVHISGTELEETVAILQRLISALDRRWEGRAMANQALLGILNDIMRDCSPRQLKRLADVLGEGESPPQVPRQFIERN